MCTSAIGHKHSLGGEESAGHTLREDDEVVKRMKLGLLDPMKSLHSAVAGVAADVRLSDEVKLDNLRLMLLNNSAFPQVLFNTDKTKLIIRGSSPELEAYCFIRWDIRARGTEHHAVVNSLSDDFKALVVDSLKFLFEDK
jgi:hypothetical protein